MLPSETSAPPHPLPLKTHSAIPTSNSEICAKDFEEATDGNFRNPWNCLQLLCQTAQGCLNPAVCILSRFRMLHGMIPHAAKIVREFLRVGPRPQPQQQWTGVKRNEQEMNTINEALRLQYLQYLDLPYVSPDLSIHHRVLDVNPYVRAMPATFQLLGGNEPWPICWNRFGIEHLLSSLMSNCLLI